MNKLNTIQKAIRLTGIILGLLPILAYVSIWIPDVMLPASLFPSIVVVPALVLSLPLAFMCMSADIAIAVSKRLIEEDGK